MSNTSVLNITQLNSLPVTAVQLAASTRTNPALSQVYHYTLRSLPGKVLLDPQPFLTRKEKLTVKRGCVLWGVRIVIPSEQRQKLLGELRRNHPGIVKMKAVS